MPGKPSIVPQPGDILAVRSPGTAARLIRFGAAMRELVSGSAEPNLDNHIAVVHHTDKAGTLWCLEGRPSGVGWRDSSDYLRSPWTVSNVGQPKTAAQRKTVCDGAEAMIGTEYDWVGIAADAASALDLGALFHPRFGQVPGHVVCSSLAAWLYGKAGLDKPAGGDRECSPGDWLAFIIGHKFEGLPQ
jgi:hypothetical protein